MLRRYSPFAPFGLGRVLSATASAVPFVAVAEQPTNAAPRTLRFETIQGNASPKTGIGINANPCTGSVVTAGGTGLVCVGPIQGIGVLASGSTPFDINTTFAITGCTTATTTCRTQSTPQ